MIGALKRIARVNWLYDHGNRTILFTGRGSATGLDWQEITRRLAGWRVRYHELRFGKRSADFYVDDTMLRLAEFDALARLPSGPLLLSWQGRLRSHAQFDQ